MHKIECVVPYPMLNLYRMGELKIITTSVSSIKSHMRSNSQRNIYRFHCKYHIELIFRSCYVYLELSGTFCILTLRHLLSSRFPCLLRPWSIEILPYLVYLRWRMNCIQTIIIIYFYLLLYININ